MSQPPQNGWGQTPSGDPYGQSSPHGGYGHGDGGQNLSAYGQQGYGEQGYGQQDGAFSQQGFDQQGYSQQGFGPDGSPAPGYGDAPGQAFAPQGAAPKKSNKLPIILCAGCALLALLLLVVGGGIFLFTRDSGSGTGGGGDETTAQGPTEQPTDEPTEEPTEEPTDEPTEEPTEDPTEEPTEEPTEAPAGEGDGTKENPYALGQTFAMEDGEGGTIDVTIGEINWDATDEVMDAAPFNTEPGDGETYILIPLQVTYHGDGELEPFMALIVEYAADSGNSYDDEGSLTPHSSFDVGTLRDGGTGEWEIGIIVPKDQIQDGAFIVDVLFNFQDEPVWVAAS